MTMQIGDQPGSGFDDPLGLMRDCHRRIERFLEMLQKVAEDGRGGPLDAQQTEALDVALRYFAGMAPKHTADEEVSLFPRIRRSLKEPADGEARAVLTTLEQLEAEHDRAAAVHAEVELLGRRWLDEGQLPTARAERLIAILRELRAVYTEHIAHEDQEVFPLAGRVLPADEIAVIGDEMAERRGSMTCSQRKAAERAARAGGGSAAQA